jgi:hypothetical protein
MMTLAAGIYYNIRRPKEDDRKNLAMITIPLKHCSVFTIMIIDEKLSGAPSKTLAG